MTPHARGLRAIMKKSPIIQLKHVSFWYDKGKPNEVHALKDINLEIFQGEYVALFGPSGSGKSTLLYAISGMDIPKEGAVLIHGKDITKYSKLALAVYRQIGVGLIFQQFNLIPSVTVLDNVTLPMAFLGVETKRRTEEGMRLLERMAIKNLAPRFPHELSGGEQQRVGIARALANNAPIILADEPLGNLDSENANKVLGFLKELHERDGRTILMVTHEAWSLRDVEKIFHFKDGTIVRTEYSKAARRKGAMPERVIGKQIPAIFPEHAMASMLSTLLLRGYSTEEVERFESLLQQRLQNELSKDQFLKAIDAPYRDGGVGLWIQTARRISAYIEILIREERHMEDIYADLLEHPPAPLAADVEQIRQWLMADYHGTLDALRQAQLNEAIYDRIRNIITHEHFKKVLNLSRKKFGVGFSLKTAQYLSDKLEMLLQSASHNPHS